MFDIVINPSSSSGLVKKLWLDEIEPIFRKAKCQYNVYYSTPIFDIVDIVRQLTSMNVEKDIVIIGGDGTMNLAINGIRNFQKTRIGFIPCGSGNDLAKGLHLSKKIEQCCQKILQKKTVRTIDIGEVIYHTRFHEIQKEKVHTDGYVHRRFNISCGIGFDASICEKVAINDKKLLNQIHLGKLIYIETAIKIIASSKRIPVTITIDNKTVNYPKLLFSVVMNTPYEGGGFAFCPQAKADDRALDICVGDGISQLDFFRIFPYAYLGKHVKFQGVHIHRAKQIHIQTKEPMWVHTDGEVACQSDDIYIQLCKEQLQMMN